MFALGGLLFSFRSGFGRLPGGLRRSRRLAGFLPGREADLGQDRILYQQCVHGLVNGADLIDQPLKTRKAKLEKLLDRHNSPFVLFSESFGDPLRLLDACEERRLEGIVSKRVDAPYRSGTSTDWIKVKCAGWRAANKDRWRMFERP